jgi:hypothetical protein
MLSGTVTNEFCHPDSPYRTVNVDTNSTFSFDASPFAVAGEDIVAGLEGDEVEITLDGSGSWDDSDIIEYIWYIDEGIVENTSSPTLVYPFTSTGVYYISLEVVDDSGKSSDESAMISTISVTVN